MAHQPKIAVLLLGNMRSFNNTFRNMDAYLLSPYNCDVYVITYDKRFNMKGNTQIREEIINEEMIRTIYGRYLRHVTIINQDNFLEHCIRIPNKSYTCGNELDRLYTIQKLLMTAYDIFRGECARNNLYYDFIIKMRPDMYLNDRMIINTSLNDNQIVIPSNDTGGGFNDHMAYGKPRVMSTYMNYYRYFHDIDNLDGGTGCDVSIIESGVRKNLDVKGIEIFREAIKYVVLREIKPQKIIFTGKNNYFIKKF